MSEVLSRNLSLAMEAEIKAQITDATHARGDTAGLAQLASVALTAARTGRFDQSTDAALEEAHLVAATTHTSSWFSFLFELGKDWPSLFAAETHPFVDFERSDPIGIKFFDQKRAPTLRIFGKKMFQVRFTRYTKGVFRLLDWSNVCVAGGAVLACLTCAPQDEAFFAGNDIDVFLYGLSPEQSSAKLAAIFSAVDEAVQGFDRVYKIVLSSGVVTFMPHSEHSGYRAIQVILRCYHNVAEILAAFDQDQCAVGTNFVDAWLEPRAVRAIKIGYMILTTNLMYCTTIRRLFKYGMRGYGVLLRVPDQDGTFVRQLASRFSDAFHRVGQEMRKRQNADVPHIPPHRSIRAKDLVAWARIKAERPFLEGYSAFCMLAALWEHDCAWTRDEVPIGYTFFEDAKGNPLDYETREMSMDSNIECEYAIRDAAQLSDEFSLSEEGIRYERVKRGTLHSLLDEPFKVLIYLPYGLDELLRTLAPATAGRDALAPVSMGSPMIDIDGVAHILHVWKRQGDTIWAPLNAQERIVHNFLKGAAGATTWSFSRVCFGSDWPTLGYTEVLKLVLKRMRVYKQLLVNTAQLQRWMDL